MALPCWQPAFFLCFSCVGCCGVERQELPLATIALAAASDPAGALSWFQQVLGCSCVLGFSRGKAHCHASSQLFSSVFLLWVAAEWADKSFHWQPLLWQPPATLQVRFRVSNTLRPRLPQVFLFVSKICPKILGWQQHNSCEYLLSRVCCGVGRQELPGNHCSGSSQRPCRCGLGFHQFRGHVMLPQMFLCDVSTRPRILRLGAVASGVARAVFWVLCIVSGVGRQMLPGQHCSAAAACGTLRAESSAFNNWSQGSTPSLLKPCLYTC
jgi:hypothetical protein